jgi:hypothetical protein
MLVVDPNFEWSNRKLAVLAVESGDDQENPKKSIGRKHGSTRSKLDQFF